MNNLTLDGSVKVQIRRQKKISFCPKPKETVENVNTCNG